MTDVRLRSIEILRLLASRPEPFAADEITRCLGIKRTTVYRCLEAMVAEGWLSKRGRPSRYSVTLQVGALGLAALSQNRARETLLSHAIELAMQLQCRVAVAFYDRGEVVYTDVVQPAGSRPVVAALGQRAPAACTAAGKILLAHQNEDELERVAAQGLPRFQPRTRTTRGEILSDVLTARERGYAVTDREHTASAAGVGMAVLDGDAAAAGALVVEAPIPLSDRFIEQVLPVLERVSARASAEMGYRAPASLRFA